MRAVDAANERKKERGRGFLFHAWHVKERKKGETLWGGGRQPCEGDSYGGGEESMSRSSRNAAFRALFHGGKRDGKGWGRVTVHL